MILKTSVSLIIRLAVGYQVSGNLIFQVSGNLILPGEPLAIGYFVAPGRSDGIHEFNCIGYQDFKIH